MPGGNWYSAQDNYYGYTAGTTWNYSNIATALAAYTVEAATQTPFDDYCETHLFEVLKMENTGWHLADFDPADVAMPTEATATGFQAYGHYGYADYPDGQLRSSVADMARFVAAISNDGALESRQVLEAATVEGCLPPVPSVDSGQYVFWYRSDANGREVIGHNGGDIGVATELMFSPTSGIGVVLLFNTDWSTVGDTASEIFKSCFFSMQSHSSH